MSDRPQDTEPFVPPEQPTRRGCGCWVTALTTLVVFVVLVGVGLFLPPINLLQRLTGPHYTTLTTAANAITESGLTLAAYDLQANDTLDVALSSVPMEQFLAGDAKAGAWVPDALAAVPPWLALQSPVYGVTTTRSADVVLSVDLPAGVNSDIFDLYGWHGASGSWQFIPAHPSEGKLVATVAAAPDRVALFQAAPVDQPRVLVAYDVTQVLSADAARLATIVSPAGLQPTLVGTLAGNLAAGFDVNAGYLVAPAIRNYADPRATDPDTVTAILANAELRREHAAQIAAFAGSGYDGVLIDYRDLPTEQRDNFSAFITDLGKQLDGAGLRLIVAVPMAQPQSSSWNTGAYDWRVIGQAADYVQIDLGSDPTIFVGAGDGIPPLVEPLLRWTVGEISRDKLLLGLSALSQRQAGDSFAEISYDQALSALGNVTIDAEQTSAGTINPGSVVQAKLDGYQAVAGDAQGQPYLDYMDANGTSVARMWLTTPDALRARMDRTLTFALGGVAFDDLLSSGIANGLSDAILSYKVQVPAPPGAQQLALKWTIQGASGIIGETTTNLGAALVTTIQAPDGNYAINVEVVSSDQSSSQRGGAAVAVFAPTATPTPLPTSTPTPTPRPTSVPVQQVANTTVTTGGGQAAVAPGAGSIVGGFEYGGHVDNPATGAAGAMRHAGMNWMKIQLRYSPGTDPGVAAGPISTAHGAGFKILLGLVGYPNDLAAGGDGYVQGFASWVGGVAALGPDAIEVWNEANIDREWPQGQISGGNYARLLSAAYSAIKGANGGVMVITAAPAPTGAEAAFPGRVQNDDNWLRDLVNAGGLQWADCVGAHYNEGIVPPNQTDGDPRDGYYTRYLLGMLNTYWSITGGQKPICFTELGYLTPEGYPPLDPYFGWASNVTVAQQAAWLAQAAAILSQSGKARLMIVWNVDFTNYGSDPMAGYAMIRPGGGCPACDALAAAR